MEPLFVTYCFYRFCCFNLHLGKPLLINLEAQIFTYFALQRLKGLGISGDFGEICGVKFMMSTVPLAIWHHLFLEFWLVDTWFFCPPTGSTCCSLPRKCTPLNYKARQKAGFAIVTYTASYIKKDFFGLKPLNCFRFCDSQNLTAVTSLNSYQWISESST